MVTGGGGFLGTAILQELKARPYQLRSINRARYPHLEAMGVSCVQADLGDYESVREAFRGVDAVFHVAAKAGAWGPLHAYYAANVQASENVLRACRELGISQLVYTSSPSVSFDGKDQENVDESVPYPASFLAAYPKTKAQAEQLILQANDKNLATCALRPHLIWGPGDPHLIPRIIDRARKGRLRLVGEATQLIDAVYVENAAWAHVCAFDRLAPGSPIGGKAYFIGNAEPWPMRDIINSILDAAGLAPVSKHVDVRVAYALASLLETVYRTLRIESEPILTRFVVAQMSTAHWYNPAAAQRDLAYEARVSMKEGFARLKKSLHS